VKLILEAFTGRRTFDAGAMRRLHAAVHVSNTAGLEPAAPILAASTRSSATESTGNGEGVSRSTNKGVWKGNKLLEGWDIDGDGKDGAVLMATALRVLKGAKADIEAFAGPKSSHGMIGAKKDPRIAEKAAADGSSGGERGVSRNHFLPRQYLRDGMPPERQMRFRKENQIVTIAIENKGASTYQLRSWLHELGADGKPLDNAQVQMPAQIVGNSVQARLFGGQLVRNYLTFAWCAYLCCSPLPIVWLLSCVVLLALIQCWFLYGMICGSLPCITGKAGNAQGIRINLPHARLRKGLLEGQRMQLLRVEMRALRLLLELGHKLRQAHMVVGLPLLLLARAGELAQGEGGWHRGLHIQEMAPVHRELLLQRSQNSLRTSMRTHPSPRHT